MNHFRSALLLFAMLLAGRPAIAAEAPTRILILCRGQQVDARYVTELGAAGFQVTQRKLTDPLSLEALKAFHLVVVPELMTLDAGFQVGAVDVPNWWETTLPNLRRYVAGGGGLLVGGFFPEAGEALCAAYERMLAPWGAGFRAAEVLDPPHIAKIAGSGSRVQDKIFYCWTDAVAKHPATAGVRRIYYPVCNMRWDDCYTTTPLVLRDRAWQPLVTAMPGAGVAKANKGYEWETPSFDDRNVIAAARSAGKGRVALLGICGYHTFFRPYTKEESLGENHHGRIDGIALQAGDGTTPSDLGRLLQNLSGWLAAPARAAGFGTGALPPPAAPPTFTTQPVINWDTLKMPPTWRHRPIPVTLNSRTYYDELPDPTIQGDLHYYKALIGARSSYSDGKGSVAQFAAAARKAGYSLLAFTERFEALGGPARWERLRRDCLKECSPTFVCLPGIDIADPEGGRYLIIGQPNYPAPTWLSKDGKYLIANNVMSLGFTTHLSAIARPQGSPHQYRLFKHYQGIAVATYRGEKLVDDGYEAYTWSLNSGSNPIPLAVHEVLSPADVPVAAKTGFQQIMPADTVERAGDYFRCALSHFFDCPQRYFISEGPVIDTWAIFNKDAGKPEENRNRYRIALGAHSDAPLREVALYADGALCRRWTPNATSFQEHVDGYHGWQHHWHLVVTDAAGRRAISPHLRTVPARYFVRCADRQNWLGPVGLYYTGTTLGWLDLHLPVKGMKDGDSTFPGVRGSNLAPMLEFPLASNQVCVEDLLLSQRYLNAEKFDEIAYDAAPMRVTVPSRLYDGKVRLTNVTPRAGGPNVVLVEVDLRLKIPAERLADAAPTNSAGAGVWPWFTGAQGKYRVRAGDAWQTGDITGATRLDLRPGDVVGDVMALSDNLRLDGGRVGIRAPQEQALPAGASFSARFLLIGRSFAGWKQPADPPFDVAAHAGELVQAAGLDPAAPYPLKLTRGTLVATCYTASVRAADHGAAGEIRGTPLPCRLPLAIEGLNPRWTAGVWRSDRPADFADQFGFVEGVGMASLDADHDARFFAGNLVQANDDRVFLNIEQWTQESIVVEANNPTDAALTVTLRTPTEIAGLKPLQKTITIPAGTSVRVEG